MEPTTDLLPPTETTIYPSLSDRVQSTFIDTIVIVVFMFLSASFLEKYDGAPDWIRIVFFFGIWGGMSRFAWQLVEPLAIT